MGDLKFEQLADPGYDAIVAQEGVLATPGADFLMDFVRTGTGPDYGFDWSRTDRWVTYAQEKKMLLSNVGHLVWHAVLPEGIESVLTAQNAEQVMVDHVQTVARRYARKVHSWNVVNETVEPVWGHPDGLRTESVWYQKLGPGFIETAFHAAREADPTALLVLNEYGFETHVGYQSETDKRRHTLALLERLLAKGVPVDALGIQAHLGRPGPDPSGPRALMERFDQEAYRTFLSDVASLGLKIMFTEVEVSDIDTPVDFATRDRMIAEAYELFLSVALDEPAVISVTTWGLADQHSWLNQPWTAWRREDGLPQRPLPYDDQYQRKPAREAMARAFDRAPAHQLGTAALPMPRKYRKKR
ncbi:endo-1,4-beta-xylanase [Streptomyces enissocaesilis]|uniref:endo-1,4-beta-xylanase n=1 Tax=Streptomyces enissocaesilis TaxID=332589 RepID=UPI0031E025BD